MSRRSFDIVLSELAQHDLTDILQYTLETWGVDQMDAYAAKLESGIRLLQKTPALGKTREDLFEGCRTHRVEHHLVLYQIGDSEIRVARILHERMDAPSRFADLESPLDGGNDKAMTKRTIPVCAALICQ